MKRTLIIYKLLSHLAELKTKYFEKIKNIDSAYFYQKISIEWNQKSEWKANQEKIESGAVAFAIEKEKNKVKGSRKY